MSARQHFVESRLQAALQDYILLHDWPPAPNWGYQGEPEQNTSQLLKCVNEVVVDFSGPIPKDSQCIICHERLDDGSCAHPSVIVSNHCRCTGTLLYGRDCLRTWLLSSNGGSCPTCRGGIVPSTNQYGISDGVRNLLDREEADEMPGLAPYNPNDLSDWEEADEMPGLVPYDPNDLSDWEEAEEMPDLVPYDPNDLSDWEEAEEMPDLVPDDPNDGVASHLNQLGDLFDWEETETAAAHRAFRHAWEAAEWDRTRMYRAGLWSTSMIPECLDGYLSELIEIIDGVTSRIMENRDAFYELELSIFELAIFRVAAWTLVRENALPNSNAELSVSSYNNLLLISRPIRHRLQEQRANPNPVILGTMQAAVRLGLLEAGAFGPETTVPEQQRVIDSLMDQSATFGTEYFAGEARRDFVESVDFEREERIRDIVGNMEFEDRPVVLRLRGGGGGG